MGAALRALGSVVLGDREVRRVRAGEPGPQWGAAGGGGGGAGAVGEWGARRVRGAALQRRWDAKSTGLGPERPTSVAREVGAAF